MKDKNDNDQNPDDLFDYVDGHVMQDGEEFWYGHSDVQILELIELSSRSLMQFLTPTSLRFMELLRCTIG